MKKVLLLSLVLAVLLVPTTVFADEVEKEEWSEFRLEQVLEYTSEDYDEWVRLFEAKDTLKVEREVLKTEMTLLIENTWKPYIDTLKGDAKVLMEAYKETLRVAVEAGEMTKEDAKIAFENYKIEVTSDLVILRATHDAEKADRLETKVFVEVLRAERKGLNETIKSNLELEVYDDIDDLLKAILNINQQLESHAIEVNEIIEDKINELNNM